MCLPSLYFLYVCFAGTDLRMSQYEKPSPQQILDFTRSYLMPCSYNAYTPSVVNGDSTLYNQDRLSVSPLQAFPFPTYMAFNSYTMNQFSYSPLLSLINTSENVEKMYTDKMCEYREKYGITGGKYLFRPVYIPIKQHCINYMLYSNPTAGTQRHFYAEHSI
jgi:hypothetical protein